MDTHLTRPTTFPPPIPTNYLADERWTLEHMIELLARYPDLWIGVLNGQVLAHGRSSGEVRQEIEQQHSGAVPYVCLIERHPRVYTDCITGSLSGAGFFFDAKTSRP